LTEREQQAKEGTIKHYIDNIALDKPSDREKRAFYLQRYVTHLPVGGEIILHQKRTKSH
jgi:polyphosphate kinase 2 (PPK2 family)